MAKIRSLSKSAIIDIQRLMSRVTALESQRGFNRGMVDAKSVYILYTPSGGIPAATLGTTRVPGVADCTIYRRLRNDSNADRVDTTNRSQSVYNFTDTDVPGLSYILGYRDAWGDVWAIPGASTCPDLPSPGSYDAVAGAAIAAGATGPVVYDGEIYQVKNHSQCPVRMGDLVGLHVSPTCQAFFVPCVCSCSAGPHDCCDKSIALCVDGYIQIVKVDGGSATWSLSDCCECDTTPTVEISIACNGNTVTGTWLYTCGTTTDTGTFDLSGLCDNPVVEYDDTITMNDCPVRIIATEEAEACDECGGPAPPCECCFELLPWSDAECDKTDVPGIVPDVGLTAVSVSSDPFCNGQTTTITLTFTNSTGGPMGGSLIQFDLSSNLPLASRPTATAASNSGTIADAPGQSGFTVEWTVDTWANGASISKTITILNNGCTPGTSQLTASVSAGTGYVCTVVWDAVACP